MICITGLGIVSALGTSVETTWKRLAAGERGLSQLSLFDTRDQKATLVGEVRGISVPDDDRSIAWSRTAAFASVAVKEALGTLDPKRARVGLVIAGTTGGMLENELPIAHLFSHIAEAPNHRDPERRSHPLSSTLDAVAASAGPFVRTRTLASACSGGASAVVIGAAWLLANQVDAVLVGGAESLCRLTVTGFNTLGIVDPEPCRPFDRARRGLNLGEGAGFLLLEMDDHAKKRRAEILAELAGWSLGSEAHHVTNPEPSGAIASRVMVDAIAHAGLRPEDVDYVSAHGTGTPLNDKTEAIAIARAFGPHASMPFVSSNKAQVGHTLGAAAAIEAALGVMVLRDGIVPPTAGLVDPDSDHPLRHVQTPERADVRVVLSNAFGFGGMDSALVLAKPGIAHRQDRKRRSLAITGIGLNGTTLDPARARRIDEPARISVSRADEALRAAGSIDRAHTAAVFGTAFGSVHASAEFVHKILEKGPRFAPPADFPNLVPSASTGHASIYLGLGGPAMSTCDLQTSLESAFSTACDLVAAGEAAAAVCGVTVEKSAIIDGVFAPLFGIAPPEPGPSLVVEAEAEVEVQSERPIVARIDAYDVVPFGEEDRLATFTADKTFDALADAVRAIAEREVRSARVVAKRPLPWGTSGAYHVAVLVRP